MSFEPLGLAILEKVHVPVQRTAKKFILILEILPVSVLFSVLKMGNL